MLENVFLWVLKRGIEIAVVGTALLLFRWIILKKVPRIFCYSLWSVLPLTVLLHLLVKLFPVQTWMVGSYDFSKRAIFLSKELLFVFKWLWILGIVVLTFGVCRQFHRLKLCLVGSIRRWKNIYLSQRISAPFTMGVFCPKIYLPFLLERIHFLPVLLHERCHIKRKDVCAKYFAMLFCIIFWFVPVVWIAYSRFTEDMEDSCDEMVLQGQDKEFREAYATAIVEISCGVGKTSGVVAGYSDGKIKKRVERVVNYKKASKIVGLVATLACVLFGAWLLTVSFQLPCVVQGAKREAVQMSSIKASEMQKTVIQVEE